MHSSIRIWGVARFLILSGYLASDYLSVRFGLPLLGLSLFLLMALDLLVFTVRIGLNSFVSRVLLTSWVLTVASVFFWESTYTVFAYLGIVLPAWVFSVMQTKRFETFSTVFLLAQLFICSFEYISQSYLFEGVANRLGNEVELSFREISGNVLRAKGTFIGPLTLSNYALGSVLIFPRNRIIVLVGLMLALLSNSRLSFLLMGVILLWYHTKDSRSRLVVALGAMTVAWLTFTVIDASGFERLIRVFDLSSDNHSARFGYMLEGLGHFSNYPIWSMLVGNSGSLLKAIGNNAESGWITLLCEFGLIGFAFFWGCMLAALRRARRRGLILVFASLFAVMSAQTFYLSFIGPLVFWYPIFQLYENSSKSS